VELLECIETGVDVIIAKTSEIYGSYSEIVTRSEELNRPIGKRIALYTVEGGLKWVDTDKPVVEIGNEKDPIMVIRSIIRNPMLNGIFIMPMFDMLSGPQASVILSPITSYLTKVMSKGNESTIILEIGKDENVHPVLASNVFTTNVGAPNSFGIKKISDVMASLAQKPNIVGQHPDLASGLTRKELWYANLACKDTDSLIRFKKERINTSEIVEITEYDDLDNFDHLIGLDNLKDFTMKTSRLSDARGVLLVGVPGTGKSAFARALGRHLDLPTINLKIDKVFDRFVGSSEARMAKAIDVLQVIGPCVVFMDEIEKSIGGSRSSNLTDGGTGSRVFSMLLKWLSDRRGEQYVVATSNNIAAIPPEFIRAERWDSIFFLDIPSNEAGENIFNLWAKHYKCKHKCDKSLIYGMTGAEIKNLVRISRAFDKLEDAADKIIKINEAMSTEVGDMREWASKWAVKADINQFEEKQNTLGFHAKTSK